MTSHTFQPAVRIQTSVLAPIEGRILRWLAERMPVAVNPDHLTALGAIAMIASGFLYYMSQWNPFFLHLVNLSLAVNWFGDSLDGTLARFRNQQRPRYGFYVDHIIDAIGTLAVMLGLVGSGWINPHLGYLVLALYLIMSVNVYLATHTLGTFSLSFWKVSPTEGRILLMAINTVVMIHPAVTCAGLTIGVFDVLGLALCAGLGVMIAVSVARNTAQLYREERVDR